MRKNGEQTKRVSEGTMKKKEKEAVKNLLTTEFSLVAALSRFVSKLDVNALSEETWDAFKDLDTITVKLMSDMYLVRYYVKGEL